MIVKLAALLAVASGAALIAPAAASAARVPSRPHSSYRLTECRHIPGLRHEVCQATRPGHPVYWPG